MVRLRDNEFKQATVLEIKQAALMFGSPPNLCHALGVTMESYYSWTSRTHKNLMPQPIAKLMRILVDLKINPQNYPIAQILEEATNVSFYATLATREGGKGRDSVLHCLFGRELSHEEIERLKTAITQLARGSDR